MDALMARRIARWRGEVITTPAWWDRDCRVCLDMPRHDGSEDAYYQRTGRTTYHTKGGDKVIVVKGGEIEEEVHADHSDEELARFVDSMTRLGRM